MASNLLETLQNIEEGRQNCIKNAKLANLPATDNMSIDSISTLFLLKNTEETVVEPEPLWERPSDWWDSEQILEDAEPRIVDGVTYYPVCLLLLNDNEDTITFGKVTSTGTATGFLSKFEAFVFSDSIDTLNIVAASEDLVHNWDEEYDKECSLGYKTRYVICYLTSTNYVTASRDPLFSIGNENSLKEVIMHNINMTYSATGGSPAIPFILAQCQSLERLVLLDSVYITPNCLYTYNIITGCIVLKQIIIHGMGHMYNVSRAINNCFALEVLKMYGLTTFSGPLLNGANSLRVLHLPDLEECSASGNQSIFGSLTNVTDLQLPKLKRVLASSTGTTGVLFSSLNKLKHLELPELETIDVYGGTNQSFILSAHALKTVNAPKLRVVGCISFITDAYNLEEVLLPSLQHLSVNSHFITNARSLKIVDVSQLEEFKITLGRTSWSGTYQPIAEFLKKVVFIGSTSSLTINVSNSLKSVIEVPEAFNSLDGTTITVGSSDDVVKEVSVCEGWKQNLNIPGSAVQPTKLKNLFNNLADVTSLGGRTIKLNSMVKTYTPAEDLEIATNKGWTVTS